MVSRRLFRFSLRTLLVFVTIVAVWLGVEVNRGRRQQAAIATIREMGGSIQYSIDPVGYTREDIKTDAPAWLVKQMGEGFFGEIETVDLTCNQSLTVEGMSSIADLRSIRSLNLAGWSHEPTSIFGGRRPRGSSLSDATLSYNLGRTRSQQYKHHGPSAKDGWHIAQPSRSRPYFLPSCYRCRAAGDQGSPT